MNISANFQLLQEWYLSAVCAEARLFQHTSGAQVLSLSSPDPLKAFGVAFRTPVQDNRGIPHILAHMLITPPSKRYPPSSGVEINDESLTGPMNAWTYPDWTIFYVETGNQADLYDQALAWLDRVFRPRFDRLTFQREGWHFTYRGGALGVSGAVYNEMKGWARNTAAFLKCQLWSHLLPDVYGSFAGGLPEEIRQLSLADVLDFYRLHYHPRNALICFWGDDPVEQRLAFVDKALEGIQSDLPAVKTPKHVPLPDPVHAAISHSENALGFCWSFPYLAASDPEAAFTLACLSRALGGLETSPLRVAIKELGERIVFDGVSYLFNPRLLNLVIPGCSPEKFEKIERTVIEVIGRAAREINRDIILAAINPIDLDWRKAGPEGIPGRGLAVFNWACSFWTYGQNPLTALRFEEVVDQVRQEATRDPTYFCQLIDRWLVNSPHYAVISCTTDPEYETKKEQEEARWLKWRAGSVSPRDLMGIAAEAERISQVDSQPDDPGGFPPGNG